VNSKNSTIWSEFDTLKASFGLPNYEFRESPEVRDDWNAGCHHSARRSMLTEHAAAL